MAEQKSFAERFASSKKTFTSQNLIEKNVGSKTTNQMIEDIKSGSFDKQIGYLIRTFNLLAEMADINGWKAIIQKAICDHFNFSDILALEASLNEIKKAPTGSNYPEIREKITESGGVEKTVITISETLISDINNSELNLVKIYKRAVDESSSSSGGNDFKKVDPIKRAQASLIYLVKGIDDNRNAWYYVLVERPKLQLFLKALNDDIIHLENYGKVLYSAYGDEPPQDVTDALNAEYGIR
jgi:hypothetical protein